MDGVNLYGMSTQGYRDHFKKYGTPNTGDYNYHNMYHIHWDTLIPREYGEEFGEKNSSITNWLENVMNLQKTQKTNRDRVQGNTCKN